MTSEEQARRSQSRHGSNRASAVPLVQPHTVQRASAAQAQSRSARRGGDASPHVASRSEGVEAYTKRRRRKRRGRVLRVLLVTFLLAIVGVGTAAALYISNINSNLNADVSDDLRALLSEPVEPQEPFYMLLLGVDKSEERANDWGDSTANFRADTIIIARIDAPAQKVTLVSIPRDTLVDMGVNGDQKINAAYSYGGAAYMVEVVEDFAGITIDAYAEIDFEQFTSIVDTIGGVEVTLPVDVVDMDYAGINLPAGTHTLDGATALALVRTRHAYDSYGGGDFYRAANQRMVIGAILKKILQLDPVSMLNTVSVLAQSITVYPLSVTDIVSLAQQFQNFDVDAGFYSGQTPTISQYINNIWYELPDEAAWQEMMERVEAGLTPYSDESQDFTSGVAGSIGAGAGSSNDGTDTSTSSITATFSGSVLVLNGTTTSGFAASTSTDLEAAGFSPYADNASSTSFTTTLIYYNTGGHGAALGVAETLGVSEENVTENTAGYSTDYDVVVVLGADLTD